jgi:transposase
VTHKRAAADAGAKVREIETQRVLAGMSVDRLKEATRQRLRIAPLTDARIRTVAQLLARGSSIQALPGIGPTTATRMLGAARTLRQTRRHPRCGPGTSCLVGP